jgi:hypothetical protein
MRLTPLAKGSLDHSCEGNALRGRNIMHYGRPDERRNITHIVIETSTMIMVEDYGSIFMLLDETITMVVDGIVVVVCY